MTEFAQARRAMIDSQLRPQAVTDGAVIAAMATVPREKFVPPAAQALAYSDREVPLGGGRSLVPPMVIGRMLSELAPAPGERALVVGGGSGYSAALLVAIGLDVTVLESETSLAATARGLLDAAIVEGPLEEGCADRAPFDLIVIDGAVELIPDAIIAQLAGNGRLGAVLVDRRVPRIVIGRRSGGAFGLRSVADAGAPRLPGFSRAKEFSF